MLQYGTWHVFLFANSADYRWITDKFLLRNSFAWQDKFLPWLHLIQSLVCKENKRAEAPAETLAIKDNSESITPLNSYEIGKRFPSLRGYC